MSEMDYGWCMFGKACLVGVLADESREERLGGCLREWLFDDGVLGIELGVGRLQEGHVLVSCRNMDGRKCVKWNDVIEDLVLYIQLYTI